MTNMEQIQLVNPIPSLVKPYRETVEKAIALKIITLDEWNKRFKFYRDDAGYSFIHYLNCKFNKIDNFITINPIMINNKKELERRFGVKIISSEDFFPAFNI